MSLSFESQKSRELIDTLRAHGLDKYISLPQVAVMGDTSSGKSSLLSSLSGITFPSSDKLTTRCPIQLILSHADTFSGKVHIQRFETSAIEGEEIVKDMSEISNHMQRLTQQLVDEGQFISDDSIVIECKGPQFPDLTLTDLPGLVRTVEDGEDASIISRVRALVNRYLKQERTVILAVIPANVDMHNVEILQAAEEADPQGNRTVAIITKPDLIDAGAEQSVIDLLLNRKKKLKLGYHAVKGRGQKDLNEKVSIKKGLVKEKEFFNDHSVWKNVDKSLVGIENLKVRLTVLLEEIIRDALPKVQTEIADRLGKTHDKLAELGVAMESPQARRSTFTETTNQFMQLVEKCLCGDYSSDFFDLDGEKDNRARAKISASEQDFKDKVNARDYENNEASTLEKGCYVRHEGQEYILNAFLEGEKVEIYTLEKNNGYIVSVDTVERVEQLGNIWIPYGKKSFSKLKKVLASHRGNQLTIFPSYQVFCNMVNNIIRQWKEPATQLLKDEVLILQMVCKRAAEHIKAKPRVKTLLVEYAGQAITRLEKDTLDAIQQAYEKETRPYTMNHYLDDVLMKMRNEPLLKALDGLGETVNMTAVKAVLKNFGVGSMSSEDQQAMEMEMAIIAYLKVARKRFVDGIPMVIEYGLVNKFVVQLKTMLLLDDEELTQLLSESPTVLSTRKSLLEELKALETSRDLIYRMR